ncbi:hypothetical protein F5X99DRAFT_408458 [Biscogniauxia marginata]|nr:hypothetical protein F5X99DRAFT_408458 [Biscogniauxia marginata]
MYFSPINAISLFLSIIIGSNTVAAWYGTFYSEPRACTDNDARRQSDYYSFEGYDFPGHLLNDSIGCQSLGSASPDPGVSCSYFAHDDPDREAQGCGNQAGGFVARSANLRGLEYCVAWEDSYDCEGDYYVWEIEPPQGGCHDGIQVRSFKCLQ